MVFNVGFVLCAVQPKSYISSQISVSGLEYLLSRNEFWEMIK